MISKNHKIREKTWINKCKIEINRLWKSIEIKKLNMNNLINRWKMSNYTKVILNS